MSKTEQIKVGGFIEEYLKKSNNIRVIVLLLDIRHNPTEDDKLMYRFLLDHNLPFFVVTNKADKIAPTKVVSACKALQKELNPLMDAAFLPFSSEKKIYTESIWQEIEKYI